MSRSSGLPRRLPPAACRALVALLLAIPAAAQDTGTVSGTIVDPTAQVVPGGTVTLTHLQERRPGRQPGRAAARGNLQSVQSGAIPGHRSHRAVRRHRRADQPELRDRDRHHQPDAPAARHPAVGAAERLRT